MRGGQRLQAGDAGNDPDMQRHAVGAQSLGDAQRAVVERGIAPDEQSEPTAMRQVLGDLRRPGRGDRIVPVAHRGEIRACGSADRQVELDDPNRPRQRGGAERAAQVDQVRLGVALARQQDQVGGVHRRLGLAGKVIGIARADADQIELDHGASSSISGP